MFSYHESLSYLSWVISWEVWFHVRLYWFQYVYGCTKIDGIIWKCQQWLASEDEHALNESRTKDAFV